MWRNEDAMPQFGKTGISSVCNCQNHAAGRHGGGRMFRSLPTVASVDITGRFFPNCS